MRQPDDVIEQLRRRFVQEYPDWARQTGTWPIRISLQPPTTTQRSADPIACHTWAEQWRAYKGPGVIEYTSSRFPTGTHKMPKTLVLGHPREVAAAHADTQQTWQRCGRRLTSLYHRFPEAQFTGIIRRLNDMGERDYLRLVTTVTWLQANPTSGMLLRQLPIEGIDTKWLAKNAHLVLALLGTSDAADDETTPVPRRRRLHERLGLRIPPDLVQVALLDPALRAQLAGMRHLAASVEDLNRWQHVPSTVVILENKETGYAITEDHTDVVVLHGHGFSVSYYAQIAWVRTARRVIYWGDIDAPGLQFVNDLRGYGIAVNTTLMDMTTLEEFRHLSVDGAGPQRKSLPHLTDTEQQLYEHLVDHAANHDNGLLLEQERIPWPHAHRALATAIGSAHDSTDAQREKLGRPTTK
ncbi:hypothetical protein SAMN05216266_11783 [Amycolatopsis marina]|uniref:Wadjet protein JetD C-terminal domain-containing protein n=1 Tax=Amycolatopsis marina TaxID=490629 RepID=A0A1I1BT86_9PSEU|nr:MULTISPECIES: DUF3322 and DUF2220 domain-containing protein [Amycolatopsis]SFB53664.1 hypothetical protein SAMN05216266_11783 [Amycolatopsis marina]